jgi:hypothetical protein
MGTNSVPFGPDEFCTRQRPDWAKESFQVWATFGSGVELAGAGCDGA